MKEHDAMNTEMNPGKHPPAREDTHTDVIGNIIPEIEPTPEEAATVQKINGMIRLINQVSTLDEAHRSTLHCIADRGPVENLSFAITRNVNLLLAIAEQHGIEMKLRPTVTREPQDEPLGEGEIIRESTPMPQEEWEQLCEGIRESCVTVRKP